MKKKLVFYLFFKLLQIRLRAGIEISIIFQITFINTKTSPSRTISRLLYCIKTIIHKQ